MAAEPILIFFLPRENKSMMKLPAGIILMLGTVLLVSGCGVNRSSARLSPDADLSKVKSFYVIKLSADKNGVNVLIRDRLIKMGYSARSGNESIPKGTDIVITYRDKWHWDVTLYLWDLTVDFRNADTGSVIATGHALHTGLSKTSPEKIVEEVLTKIFGQAGLLPRNTDIN